MSTSPVWLPATTQAGLWGQNNVQREQTRTEELTEGGECGAGKVTARPCLYAHAAAAQATPPVHATVHHLFITTEKYLPLAFDQRLSSAIHPIVTCFRCGVHTTVEGKEQQIKRGKSDVAFIMKVGMKLTMALVTGEMFRFSLVLFSATAWQRMRRASAARHGAAKLPPVSSAFSPRAQACVSAR